MNVQLKRGLTKTKLAKGGFSLFSQEGGKNSGGVEVICNMSFLLLWEEQA